MTDESEWNARVAAVWREAIADESVIRRIDALADERAVDEPVALFERASARDFVGATSEAEMLYRRALSAGLGQRDRRRAVEATVQLASSLRLLGRSAEALDVIDTIEVEVGDEELDWLSAFRALALLDCGRADEAARGALRALAAHLSQYNESVRRYAAEPAAP